MRFQIALEHVKKALAVDFVLARAAIEIVCELAKIDAERSIRIRGLDLLFNVEAANTGQGYDDTPIIEFLICSDASGTSNATKCSVLAGRAFLINRGALGLSDADDAIAGDNILDHLQVTGLKQI